MHLKLAVITPVGRESDTLESFVSQVRNQIGTNAIHFFVTDPFTDSKSKQIVEKLASGKQNVHISLHESNGIAAVYIAGYEAAIKSSATHFLEIDAGFSHSPAQIERFISASKRSNIVFGRRANVKGISEYRSTFPRKIISRGGSILASLILRKYLADFTTGFQLFRREELESILSRPLISKGPFFQTEMKARALGLNVGIEIVPISYQNPSHKITSNDLIESVRSLIEIRKEMIHG